MTPNGLVYVLVNANDINEPFEVHIEPLLKERETEAASEALSNLINYLLSVKSQLSPRLRTQGVITQLQNIGSTDTSSFNPNCARSIPDAVARALKEFLDSSE